MARTFLKAEWRKLLLCNYALDPAVLQPYLPAHTTLDLWQNTCYVSLVGFMFCHTRVLGLRIPFHIHFEEVNLRFYVRHEKPGEIRRGVVFIREIVPRPALSWVANTLYGEHYLTRPMRHQWKQEKEALWVQYQWKMQQWHTLQAKSHPEAEPIAPGSEAEFITEHYWGYTRLGAHQTAEYEVVHPRWQCYPVLYHHIEVDFAEVYGLDFAFLNRQTPRSVFLAEGSDIAVRMGRRLK
ncbi:MAG: DUF2071 domain-containing protein [Microscillaceae bacterium]|nr:DUF2071 domain-containing protein [Microscillaceae bacterium]